jgi:hypothetical protein
MDKSAKAVIESTAKAMPEHMDTILTRSVGGSQWNRDLTVEMFASLPWIELEDEERTAAHIDTCDYYYLPQVSIEEYFPNAVVAMETSNNLDPNTIQACIAEHAPEGKVRYELRSSQVSESHPSQAWLIVGEHSGSRVVYTSFPGEITIPISLDWDGDLSNLDLSQGYAVKAL